jgi:hypothetical protein
MAGIGAVADYPGGGYRTRVGGSPGAAGTSGGIDDWLSAALRRKASQGLRAGNLENEFLEEQLDQARRAGRAARAPRLAAASSPLGIENQTRRFALQQARDAALQSGAQTRAMTGPAPTKMMFGAGVIPGRTLDPYSMSGAQRQMFLPQESAEIGGPISDIARAARAEEVGKGLGQFQTDARRRAMLAGVVPGFTGPEPTVLDQPSQAMLAARMYPGMWSRMFQNPPPQG